MKMKNQYCLTLLLLLGSTGLLWGQQRDEIDASDYFVIGEGPSTAWIYKMGDVSFTDFFMDSTVVVNGVAYVPRLRTYSTGGVDTTYYRAGANGYYHLNTLAVQREATLTLPKQASVGQKWFEVDSSWSYTITSLSAELKQYKNLIVVQAMQVKGEATKIGTTYDMYFAPGLGMLATMTEGKVLVYLSEFRHPVDRAKTETDAVEE